MTSKRIRVAALLSAFLALSRVATAQMPGVPVLQNAWANPGITVAVNAATAKQSSVLAAAGAWAPSSGRFQVSGGVGYRDSKSGGAGAAFGARVTVPLVAFAEGAIGVAGFAGIGGASEPEATFGVRRGGSTTQVPIGAAVGYRRALRFIRGVSLYGTPFYAFNRLAVGDSTISGGAFRVGLGADVGVTSRIGVTIGADLGGTPPAGDPGPRGSILGVGVSMALGRR